MVLARKATPTLCELRKRSDSGLSQAQIITGGNEFMLAVRNELGSFALASLDRNARTQIAVKARTNKIANFLESSSLISLIT